MNSDEQRLSQLLKMSVPHPPHALSADQVTTRQVDRSAKSWAVPAMAAAAVAVVGVTAGVLASNHVSGGRTDPSSPGGAPAASAIKPTVTPSSSASPRATPTCRAEESVPAVTGMTQAAAVQVLAAAGYTVTVTTTASGQVPAGTVTAQSPAAGTRLPPGGAVGLRVAAANRTSGGGAGAPTSAPATPASTASCPAASARPPAQGAKVAVPEVVGMTQATAMQLAQAVGFTVTIVTMPPPASQPVPPGTVYKQTPAGGSVAARGTQITLYLP